MLHSAFDLALHLSHAWVSLVFMCYLHILQIKLRNSLVMCLSYSLMGVGAVVQLVEYLTRKQMFAGSTHTWSTASNLEQVAHLLCAQAN